MPHAIESASCACTRARERGRQGVAAQRCGASSRGVRHDQPAVWGRGACCGAHRDDWRPSVRAGHSGDRAPAPARPHASRECPLPTVPPGRSPGDALALAYTTPRAPAPRLLFRCLRHSPQVAAGLAWHCSIWENSCSGAPRCCVNHQETQTQCTRHRRCVTGARQGLAERCKRRNLTTSPPRSRRRRRSDDPRARALALAALAWPGATCITRPDSGVATAAQEGSIPCCSSGSALLVASTTPLATTIEAPGVCEGGAALRISTGRVNIANSDLLASAHVMQGCHCHQRPSSLPCVHMAG